MAEPQDFQSALEAAERAAGAGDYMAAERHLSEAASQQEASLGPLHPDLANTLNNLGVVYETNDKPADAERCYRRAYAIAIAAFEPDHPFVATSEKNLRDFCEARGMPLHLPEPMPVAAPVPAPAPAPAPPPALAAMASVEAPAEPARAAGGPPSEAHRESRRLGAGALIGVVLVASLVAARMWFSVEVAQQPPPAAPAMIATPTPSSSAPAAAPAPAAPAPAAPKAARRSGPAAPARSMKGTAAAPPRSRGAAPAAAAVRATVADANLCRTLSTASWRCDPADRQVPAGQLFFYTRIKSPAAATIEHRWYRGDRLERVVALRIQPNQRSGFRTFSRTAVKPGNWRVELRTRGGPVLHEEHFVVR